MKTIVEIKIPEDYIICCAVNINGKEELFSYDIIKLLFSTMNSKWLPLAAYKKTFLKDTGEERLYIAYNPRIIDRSRINQMEGEITNFFHTNLPTVKIEFGGKVRYKTRNRYQEPPKYDIISNNSSKKSNGKQVASVQKSEKEKLIDIVEQLKSCAKARKGTGITPLARVHCLYDGNAETFWFTSRLYSQRELSKLKDFGIFVPQYSYVAIKMQKEEVGKSFDYKTKDHIKRLKKHHVLLENQSNLQNNTIAIAGDSLKYQYRDIHEFFNAIKQNWEEIRDVESRISELEKSEKISRNERNSINSWKEKYRILTQQQEDLKNITIYIRNQGEMRYSHIVDPIQTAIWSQNLYDGKTIIIKGGPGTGKTTTMIHRLSYLTNTFAIKEDERDKLNKYQLTSLQRKKLREAIKDNRDWMFFSPSQLLKEYLADAMKKEGLANTSEKVWNWEDYCRIILQENYHLLETKKHSAPFKVFYSDDTLFYQGYDIIEVFKKFYIGQLRGIKDHLPQLKEGGKVYKWKAIAQNIQKRFEDVDNYDLAHFVSLFNTLESIYGGDCKWILRDRNDDLNILAEKICDLLNKNNKAKSEVEEIFELTSDELLGENQEEEDLADDTENEESENLRSRIIEWFNPKSGKKQNESELSGEIRKWLKSYCYSKVSDEKKLSDEQKLIADILLPVIGSKFDDEIQKIGELMIFEQFAKYTRGIRPIMLNVIPSRYKSFRIFLNKTMHKGCNQKLLREIIQSYQGKELHRQEQGLLLGFINSMIKQIKTAAITNVNHDYIDAYNEVARPIIGIDEATDFSIYDIYAMQSLLTVDFSSLTLCGDIMQRMTNFGILSWNELDNLVVNPTPVEMKTSYRQSKKLLDVARQMFYDTRNEKPSYQAFMKSNKVPAPLVYVNDNELDKIEWISERISEVHRAYGGILPSIAIFVTHEGYIPQFISYLENTDFFVKNKIKVLDGTKKTSTPENHICVYPISVVKGMEFDVVFFHNIDKTDADLDKVRRYIYVGVSRAAFFLGITMIEEKQEISRYFVKNKDWFNI